MRYGICFINEATALYTLLYYYLMCALKAGALSCKNYSLPSLKRGVLIMLINILITASKSDAEIH